MPILAVCEWTLAYVASVHFKCRLRCQNDVVPALAPPHSRGAPKRRKPAEFFPSPSRPENCHHVNSALTESPVFDISKTFVWYRVAYGRTNCAGAQHLLVRTEPDTLLQERIRWNRRGKSMLRAPLRPRRWLVAFLIVGLLAGP